MNQYFFFIGDYLKGKPIYPVARRILNLLFSISLTSFFFEKFYFKYHWIDISNYKGILDFFIKGDFFVPFSIFIVVHYFLGGLADIIFFLLTFKKSNKLIKSVYNYEFKKSDYKTLLEGFNNNPVGELPFEISKSTLSEIIQQISPEISSEQWQLFVKGIEEQKNGIQENFKLAVKAIVTITVYFSIVPHFGWLLYLFVLILLFILLISLYYGYLLMDLLPAAIKRFYIEVSRFVKTRGTKDVNKNNKSANE